MVEQVEFYFDFLSPYSYLAYRQARLHLSHLKLIPKPISLPQIIFKSQNTPPANLPPRAEYLKKDLKRSAEFYGLETGFKVPETFPFDTRKELYKLIEIMDGCGNEAEIDEFIMGTWKRIFHQHSHPSKKQDEYELKDPKNLQKFKLILMKNTKEALDLGAYGVPFWRVTNSKGEIETFFGSDRFHHMALFLGINPLIFYTSKL